MPMHDSHGRTAPAQARACVTPFTHAQAKGHVRCAADAEAWGRKMILRWTLYCCCSSSVAFDFRQFEPIISSQTVFSNQGKHL